MQATLAGVPTPAPSPTPHRLLGRRAVHHKHGKGAISFKSTSRGPLLLQVTFRLVTLTGTPHVLRELGVRLAEGYLRLPFHPARLHGHDAVEGLAICEFAVRRDLDAEFARAA